MQRARLDSMNTTLDAYTAGQILALRDYQESAVVASNFAFADHLELSISREQSWPGDDLLLLSDLTPSNTPPTTRAPSPEPIFTPSPSSSVDCFNGPLCSLHEELFGLGPLTPLSSPNASRPSTPTLPPPSGPNDFSDGIPQSKSTAYLTSIAKPANSTTKRKARSKAQAKANKKRKREREKEGQFSVPARETPAKKYVAGNDAIRTAFRYSQSKHTLGAYRGMKNGHESSQRYRLDDLVGPNSKGFRLVKWDGIKPNCILDSEGRIVTVLGGQPGTEDWARLAKEGAALMAEARGECRSSSLTAQESNRGNFYALRCGVSHGGGQTHPQKLANNSANERLLRKLNAAEPFRRFTGFASSVFATWAPKLHAYYSETAQRLYGKYPDLPRPFKRSVFCASTYNLGPSTVCLPHIDMANLSFGWCAIMALGHFDPTKGGHLVLWNCGLVIEFPPGSLILLPSATISHSNVDIDSEGGETRYSFTQYTAGGIFRWVENGFTTLEKYKASLGDEEVCTWQKWMQERWSFGLSLIPNISSEHFPPSNFTPSIVP